MSGEKVTVLICDDHPMVRQGLRTFLELDGRIEVVGEAGDGEAAIALAERLRPDVILLDVVMPKKDGMAVLDEVQRRGLPCRVVFLTSFMNPDMAVEAVQKGALGFLTKDLSPDALAEAIHGARRGEPQLHPDVTKRLIARASARRTPDARDLLTERELQILKLLATGLSNREIGERLFISEKTVKTHISSILDKLQLKDRTQAALYAVREKLV